MRAARLHEYGHPLVLEDVPTPRPARGQVVVRVVGAGFCHSLKILKLLSGAPIIAVDVSDDKRAWRASSAWRMRSTAQTPSSPRTSAT